MDQSVVQRYMASRTLREAKRTMCIGVFLNIIYMFIIGVMAMALIYWYRDCDPVLTGEISNTISSIINSQAAVCYMDVVSMFVKLEDHSARHLTKGLAFLFGILMTIYSMIVPYLGSAVRVVVVMHNGASGPFVGMFLLAFLFPWANTKGVVAGTLFTTALQFWQMFGKIYYGIRAPLMPVTTDFCPVNSTMMTIDAMRASSYSTAHRNADVFPLYRFSSNWGVLASAVLTILIGLVVSLLTGPPPHYRVDRGFRTRESRARPVNVHGAGAQCNLVERALRVKEFVVSRTPQRSAREGGSVCSKLHRVADKDDDVGGRWHERPDEGERESTNQWWTRNHRLWYEERAERRGDWDARSGDRSETGVKRSLVSRSVSSGSRPEPESLNRTSTTPAVPGEIRRA
ncbi:hypothetical protein HPB49_003122 [Dermacentor silvarum]|uniref:Uncharacterized protein n=1 Tax=Dermacentor silvarum TaxID=543639 RepID=A0ACB8DTJ5_DERSI|nr:hypothetical protein HPB49_003122 [Dermacentor silvarum]